MMLMANRKNELGIKNSNLTSTPRAKKKNINFPFLSNRCVFYPICNWFSIKNFETVSPVWLYSEHLSVA